MRSFICSDRREILVRFFGLGREGVGVVVDVVPP